MKDWQPMSFSPRTGLLYIPHQNLCEDIEAMADQLHRRHAVRRRERRLQGRPRRTPRRGHRLGSGRGKGGLGDQGEVPGLERHGRDRGRRGVLRDDGRLVQGGATRRPASCCGSSSAAPGSSASRSSISGPDGHQYVAVFSGVGGWAGAIVSNDLDTRDATAGNGFGGACADLKTARHAAACSTCSRSEAADDRAGAGRWRWSPRCVCGGELGGARRGRCFASAPIRTTCRSRTARGEGFENRIAELIAADRGARVEYTWWAQRRGFVRNTLRGRRVRCA